VPWRLRSCFGEDSGNVHALFFPLET
jgi:hypothetical protein